MTLAVLAWQLIIFASIAVSGRKRGWVTALWVVWTVIQVATLPLSVVQFATVWLGFVVAKPRKAVQHRSVIDTATKPVAPHQEVAPATAVRAPSTVSPFDPSPNVDNCRFAYRCSKRWNDLNAIPEQSAVRYCADCQMTVHLCTSYTEAERHAKVGHCVAIRLPDDEYWTIGDLDVCD